MTNRTDKLYFYALTEILNDNTDELNSLSTSELLLALDDAGFTVTRQTLAKDLELINENIFELGTERKGKEKAYYRKNCPLDRSEVKLVFNALKAASFIDGKTTVELSRKLSDFAGYCKRDIFEEESVIFAARKKNDIKTTYNIGIIEDAIRSSRKIHFRYCRKDYTGKLVERHGGKKYTADPVVIAYVEDQCYLVSHDSSKGGTRVVYRVDRMKNIEISEMLISADAIYDRADIPLYLKTQFKMYGGEPCKVILRFTEKEINAVFDKFGDETRIYRIDEKGNFEAVVDIEESPTFYAWIFQFENMEIRDPEPAAERYKEFLTRRLSKLPT
ncbi:MAG: WYL domain-containing protein [Oscillospiraceae bacterium]|nr:WYL domain-containing protein [Oscillospiraceae bacterium]